MKPVTIRGVTYASAAEAAAALGVARDTIYGRLYKGTIDDLWPNPGPRPVRIRGKTYESAAAAAKALGVTPSAVYAGLHRGRPDSIGIGPGKLGLKGRGGRPSIRLTIGPLTFPSCAEAARQLGYSPTFFSDRIRTGKPIPQEAIGRAMALAVKQERARQ